MNRFAFSTVALLATTLAAPAFASDTKFDRGFSDLQSHEVVIENTESDTKSATGQETLSTQNERVSGVEAGFGILQDGYEPGRL
ncbi:hypothetical protein [Aestuariivita boseongensis]|uniref:hypothetical protein n=1 Tax=Aestuariivita boseongensis TaxID=1470562 RepID=UPI000682F51A|nr:hypothetical protein [Aestuariivita boseongensis]